MILSAQITKTGLRAWRAKTMPQVSYAAAAAASASAATNNAPGQGSRTTPSDRQDMKTVKTDQGSRGGYPRPTQDRSHRKRSSSPAHVPRTALPEKDVYVLTFLTDKEHHDALTSMRNKYFPSNLNKLEAHLTLFHALPGSKLEGEILPVLNEICSTTDDFQLMAGTPFRLKHGIAISVPKASGGDSAKNVHMRLKRSWQEFLSDQDAGGFRAHYTIMNKVDDNTKVDAAMQEVERTWKGSHGVVEGLTLWLYTKGRWEFFQDFKFKSHD